MPVQDDSTNFLSKKELNSEKFYETINLESSNLLKYHQKCKNIDGLIMDVHMIKICEKYLIYLEDCEKLNKQSSGYDVFILFIYWLYDELTNIYGSKNYSKISLDFANLQYLWSYENYSKINESNYKKIDCPEFYDKCKNYNPTIVLNTLNCHEKMKNERDPNLENAALEDFPGKVLESDPGSPGPLLSGIDRGSHDTYSTSGTSQIVYL
ncbi:PIR Superfamily Protein [Plasmodium ovale wallikeri]|uniref:PIR Superfamily Protein n=1 Tax=Plasmodium ovale wallikeri TaxID=864142 RepID=A0A1A9AKJ4_PLAOA|nr:PIR Superfamily Protein [Plasmodium ovale wallikeri]